MSLPTVRSLIVLVGILVALLIGIFSLHAANRGSLFSVIGPEANTITQLQVDAENMLVSSAPLVFVYDKNFDLILSTNMSSVSQYEKEHLDRLLNICELLLQNEETTIYWLDK